MNQKKIVATFLSNVARHKNPSEGLKESKKIFAECGKAYSRYEFSTMELHRISK